MLAMLLEMTWTLSSWAIIPVAAVLSARMWWSPDSVLALRRNFGEPVDGVALHVAGLLQYAGDRRVGARDLHHARHLDHAAHIRLLEIALHDAHALRQLRRLRRRRRLRHKVGG